MAVYNQIKNVLLNAHFNNNSNDVLYTKTTLYYLETIVNTSFINLTQIKLVFKRTN